MTCTASFIVLVELLALPEDFYCAWTALMVEFTVVCGFATYDREIFGERYRRLEIYHMLRCVTNLPRCWRIWKGPFGQSAISHSVYLFCFVLRDLELLLYLAFMSARIVGLNAELQTTFRCGHKGSIVVISNFRKLLRDDLHSVIPGYWR